MTIYTINDMVYIMQRYQIYLKPHSVNVLADLAEDLNMSRSQIIRDVIDRMAKEYEKLIKTGEMLRMKNNPLLKMAGFAKSPTKKVSQNIDEIYLKD